MGSHCRSHQQSCQRKGSDAYARRKNSRNVGRERPARWVVSEWTESMYRLCYCFDCSKSGFELHFLFIYLFIRQVDGSRALAGVAINADIASRTPYDVN